MTPPTTWWNGPMTALDLETTAPEPERARIVTAAVVSVHGGAPVQSHTWLADPGVEIPDSAAEIHGVTTGRAQADGQPIAEVLTELFGVLGHRPENTPLVIFNARYDLTVLDRELRRHLNRALGAVPWVVCPFVIDKWLDRYRRGPRTLGAMCEHYAVSLAGAHDAAFDAVAAARIAWRIGAGGEVVRRVRGPREGAELAALQREWQDVRGDLTLLHAAQMRWVIEERERFAAYKRSVGEHETADRIECEHGWPVLDVMAHEEEDA